MSQDFSYLLIFISNIHSRQDRALIYNQKHRRLNILVGFKVCGKNPTFQNYLAPRWLLHKRSCRAVPAAPALLTAETKTETKSSPKLRDLDSAGCWEWNFSSRRETFRKFKCIFTQPSCTKIQIQNGHTCGLVSFWQLFLIWVLFTSLPLPTLRILSLNEWTLNHL